MPKKPKDDGKITLVPALREPLADLLGHAELNGTVTALCRQQIRQAVDKHRDALNEATVKAVASVLDVSAEIEYPGNEEKVKAWAKKERKKLEV